MKKNFFIFFLVSIFFIVSCSKEKPIDLTLQNPECINPELKWALVTESFVVYRDDCNFDSDIISQGRLGDIEKIIGTSRKKNSTWYYLRKGWIESSSIHVYDTELKAISASKKFNEK